MNTNKNYLIPIFSFSNKLEFLYNDKDDESNIILIKNNGDYEDCTKINTSILKKTDNNTLNNLLSVFMINLSLPSTGYYYSIYPIKYNDASKKIDNILSKTNYYIASDSKRDYVKKIIFNAGFNEEKEPFKDLLSSINDDSNIFTEIFNLYNSSLTKEEHKIDYAKILKLIVDSVNNANVKALETNADNDNKGFKLNLNQNNNNTKISVIDNKISLNPQIEYSKIIAFNMIDNQSIPVFYDNLLYSGKTELPLKQDNDSLYLYVFYDLHGDVNKVLFNFVPNNAIYVKWRKEELDKNKKFKIAAEKTYTYPSSLISLSDTELTILSLIKEVEPKQPLFKSPIINNENGDLIINIGTESEYKLLKQLNKSFYISVVEPELMLNKEDIRRIPIKANKFIVKTGNYDIYDEPYMYWIEDDNGIIVSNVRLIDFSDTKNAAEYFALNSEVESDEDIEPLILSDFDEKLRKFELYNYTFHLWPYLINKYTTNQFTQNIESEIRRIYSTIEDLSSTSLINVADRICDECCIKKNFKDIPYILKAVSEDSIIYGSYIKDFFNKPFRYFYKENKIALPPRNNCLYIIDCYKVDCYRDREYINADTAVNLNYTINDYDFAVIWAIDTMNYKRSGFVIIDFTDINKLNAKTFKYLIEEVEVIY